MDRWQDVIDERADVTLEEFLGGDRVDNLVDVPVGGDDCQPRLATTIAADRAGTLEVTSPVAALARGILLADVAEMHFFGPGLDPRAPLAEVDAPAPDVEELRASAPEAGASCAAWATHVIDAVQMSIDAAASIRTALLFETARFAEPEDAPVLFDAQAALETAVGGAEKACVETELWLEVAGRWDELKAEGLTATLILGGITDDYYDEFSEYADAVD